MVERRIGRARTALLVLALGLGVAWASEARTAGAESASAPDARVTYVAKAANGTRTTYTFLVTNVGDAVADELRLTHTTTQAVPGRRAAAREESSGGSTVVTLAPRESMTLTVVCDPEPKHACTGADLRAATPDDRDPRDNWDISR